MFCHRNFTMAPLVLLAGISASAFAQPLRPPIEPAPAAVAPVPAASTFIPGYLGIVADDRKDAGVGARITEVTPGSPAALAGLRAKDLVTGMDGRTIHSADEFIAALQPVAAGGTVALEIVRLGRTQNVQVTLGPRPAVVEVAPPPATAAYVPAAAPRPLLGVRTLPVNESDRLRLGLPTASGARVVARVPGSPATQIDIPIDAVITGVNGDVVTSPSDLSALLVQAGGGSRVELSYFVAGQLVHTRVTLGEAPAGPPAATVVRAPVVAAAPAVPVRATAPDIPRPPVPGATGLPGAAEQPSRVDTVAAPLPGPAVPDEISTAARVVPAVQTDVQRLDALEKRMADLEKQVQELNAKLQPRP